MHFKRKLGLKDPPFSQIGHATVFKVSQCIPKFLQEHAPQKYSIVSICSTSVIKVFGEGQILGMTIRPAGMLLAELSNFGWKSGSDSA